MHQRSALLLVLLRSLTWKLLISPTFLFSTHDTKCYSLMADWCKIDGERKGCEAKNERTNQQTFQTQSRFASQIRFHRRSFENGKIVIFFFKVNFRFHHLAPQLCMLIRMHGNFFWSQSREKTMGVHVIKVAINELMWWALTFGVTY